MTFPHQDFRNLELLVLYLVSETSQTRQPQLFVYCLPQCLLFIVVCQFITRMPFCKGQSCASQQRWPPYLCFPPKVTSLASKTLIMFYAQRPLVRPVFSFWEGGRLDRQRTPVVQTILLVPNSSVHQNF